MPRLSAGETWLLPSDSFAEVGALRELMDPDLREKLSVADALTPVQYRVYPDTPLLEVLDLIVRRGLRVVPVVGEHYEILGVITAGDSLKHLLSRPHSTEGEAGSEEDGASIRACDVMTRSLLCVSEDQALTEAANKMVNRDVDQLPVVRAGELVGLLTRESALRMLFKGQKEENS